MTSATAKYHDMLNSVREFMKLHEVTSFRSRPAQLTFILGAQNFIWESDGLRGVHLGYDQRNWPRKGTEVQGEFSVDLC